MYLISIYFDDETDKKIRSLIKQVAKNTGNNYMLDDNVPPHITISAFETNTESEAVHCLEKCTKTLSSGRVEWVSVGVFLPYVIYLTPLLDKYLFQLSETVYDNFKNMENISINRFYQPFQWLPHTTIGRKLSEKEMRIAFETLQKQFGVFSGTVTKIGIARTNPHRDIKVLELKKAV